MTAPQPLIRPVVSGSASVAPPAAGGRPGDRRTGRATELGLLVFGLLVVAGLSVSVEAAMLERVTLDSLVLPGLLALVFGGVHVAVRLLAPYADPVILPCVAFLNGIGLIVIQRLGMGDGDRAEDFAGQAPRQVQWTVIAAALFVVILLILRDHRVLARYAYTLGFGGLVFVMIPAFLPKAFSEVNNAKIWIIIPGLFQIQPGEFAKLALMVFYAAYLVSKREVLSLASRRVLGIDLPRGRDLGPVLLAWLLSLAVLVFQGDLGTSLMYFGIFIVMLYIATERTSWLLIGLGLFAAGAVAAWRFTSRVQLRVSIWLDPFADFNDDGFQIVQSLFGLGSGGLFGTGPGAGEPDRIPFASTDFITAAIGEEAGLFGLTGVLAVYALLAQRGMRTSLDVRDSFGKLLAGGLAFSLGWQVFVIVGGVSKLIPLTGLTTPFLSYGGSSLLANWMLVALLLRISDAARRPAPTAPVPLKNAATEVVRL